MDPATPGYDPTKAFHFVHPLTQYIAQKKIRKTKNLLAAAEETDEVRLLNILFRNITKFITRLLNLIALTCRSTKMWAMSC